MCSEKISDVMANLQSTYDNLMDTAAKRQAKLEESFAVLALLEGVEEFKQWIAERQSVLIITELGDNTEEAMVSGIVKIKYIYFTFFKRNPWIHLRLGRTQRLNKEHSS